MRHTSNEMKGTYARRIKITSTATASNTTYLLAKFTEISKILRRTLMGFEFLWKCSKNTSGNGDITWHDINLCQGTKLKEIYEKDCDEYAELYVTMM